MLSFFKEHWFCLIFTKMYTKLITHKPITNIQLCVNFIHIYMLTKFNLCFNTHFVFGELWVCNSVTSFNLLQSLVYFLPSLSKFLPRCLSLAFIFFEAIYLKIVPFYVSSKLQGFCFISLVLFKNPVFVCPSCIKYFRLCYHLRS